MSSGFLFSDFWIYKNMDEKTLEMALAKSRTNDSSGSYYFCAEKAGYVQRVKICRITSSMGTS